MATTSTNSHSGKHRSDPEIEKYRLELNWTKILDKLKTSKISGFISIFYLNFNLFLLKNIQNFWMQKLN
jgi:hypothetical protein